MSTNSSVIAGTSKQTRLVGREARKGSSSLDVTSSADSESHNEAVSYDGTRAILNTFYFNLDFSQTFWALKTQFVIFCDRTIFEFCGKRNLLLTTAVRWLLLWKNNSQWKILFGFTTRFFRYCRRFVLNDTFKSLIGLQLIETVFNYLNAKLVLFTVNFYVFLQS